MDSSQPSPENKEKPQSSQPGSNYVWYLLGLAVLLMLVVTQFGSPSSIEIDWSDFKRLVEATNTTDPEAPGSVILYDEESDPPRYVYLSNLSNLVVDYNSVRGKVDRYLFSTENAAETSTPQPVPTELPVGGKPEQVSFRVNWYPHMKKAGELLDENGLPYRGANQPSPFLDWIPTLLMMGLLVGLMIFMLRRLGGAGSPMAFGRSRGKLYAQEDLDITFDDVAGIEEAVDELREVVDFLKNPERYQRLGGRIPKGVLLVGPPGTGKTLLSKAVAGEAGVPFFSLSGSDFVEMFVGVGAARVRDMFQQAEQRAPCIIFIDELDALGKTRGNSAMGSHDEREQTLNALLVEMDGFGTNSGVIVMGATNRPETLDPALMRPGRFDRQVLVDRPDVAGRKEILDVHLGNVKVGDDVDVEALAAITSGFVGADLANIVNEAALLAARKELDMVTMAEFNEAIERVGMGLEKKSRILQDDEKLRTAYHEAGHALVAYALPNTDPVHKVTIIPRGFGALGYMWQRPENDRFTRTQGQLESDIQVMLAGTIAEEIVFDEIATGATSDLQKATETARAMIMDYGMSRLGRVNFREQSHTFIPQEGVRPQHHSEQTAREIDQEVKRIIDESLEKTRRILSERRPALEAITQTLMEKEVIDGDQLAVIIGETSPEPKLVPGTVSERKQEEPKNNESSADTAEG